MLKLVENHKMEWMMDKIRSVETKDKDCNEYPRLKQSDDATAILIVSELKKNK
jgi:hypothetical protein